MSAVVVVLASIFLSVVVGVLVGAMGLSVVSVMFVSGMMSSVPAESEVKMVAMRESEVNVWLLSKIDALLLLSVPCMVGNKLRGRIDTIFASGWARTGAAA